MNNKLILPDNALFTSFDYGGNIICAPDTHPHSGTIFELSIMVGVEFKNIDGKLAQNAVIMLSNESSHNWYSAVPSYKKYIKMKKREFRSRGKNLATHIFYSDRGPSDFWTGPFINYSIDVCNEEKVDLNMNTTCSGHGKYVHDTLIATTKRKTKYGFKEGLMPIGPGDSVAGRTCTWLSSAFDPSETDYKYEWQFIEVPAEDIIVANSPTDRILTKAKKGIKSYHSLFSDTKGNVKFKEFSCACTYCMSGIYDKCNEQMHCGEWVDCDLNNDHLPYESLQPKDNPLKRRRLSV